MIVASVSTTGRRIAGIVPTLKSIRAGTMQPDKLILWLNGEASPVGPGTLPEDVPPEVERLGCEVRWCENIGPATKLLPAMQAFPEAMIATFDDDMLYHPTWLQRLVEGMDIYQAGSVCYRARYVRFSGNFMPRPYNLWTLLKNRQLGPLRMLIPTGVHGVIYAPGSLRPEAFDVGLLKRLSLPNDDLWFAATRATNPVIFKPGGVPVDRKIRGPRLSRRNCRGRNDIIIGALTRHFGDKVPWWHPKRALT
jgi:hypothetical protein